ncbi:MAG: hypothetical protein ACTSXW_05690 [Candidatus Baldrarchaeia archaeon]
MYAGEIIQFLASLFEESRDVSNLMYRILSLEEDRISFKDILFLAEDITGDRSLGKELAEETILSMYWWRMLLPIRMKHVKNLSWENRLLLSDLDEIFEIPICIRYAFEGLCKNGTWDHEYSIYRYFSEIKEPCKDLILHVVNGLVEKTVSKYYVTASSIREECKRQNFPSSRVGILIAELKGGGFISPLVFSPLPKILRLKEEPLYELNKALFVLKLQAFSF